jgi:hypothetical protein
VRASERNSLLQLDLVCADRLGDGCDVAEVVGVVDLDSLRVEVIGKLLEPFRSPLDLIVCVPPDGHLFTRETGGTSAGAPSHTVAGQARL